MSDAAIRTDRLCLVLQTPAEVLTWVDGLPPEVRAEISPDWLARVRSLTQPDPWSCMFSIVEHHTGTTVGGCGFKGPPDPHGVVEIAYGIDDPHRGRGFATEAALALVRFATEFPGVRTVRAHTRADNPASHRVLAKAGFTPLGEVLDPEDGLVHRWERATAPGPSAASAT